MQLVRSRETELIEEPFEVEIDMDHYLLARNGAQNTKEAMAHLESLLEDTKPSGLTRFLVEGEIQKRNHHLKFWLFR